CLDENGLPLVRRCLAHNKWEELGNITCHFDATISEWSESLNEIQLSLDEDVPFRDSMSNFYKDVVQNTSKIVGNAENKIRPVDVVYVNKIINVVAKKTKTEDVSSEIIGLYDQLMDTDDSVLELSARLNATNNLLYNFEDYIDKLEPLKNCKSHNAMAKLTDLVDVKDANGLQILISNKLSVFYLYPECNQYTGIAIYDRAGPNRQNCRHHHFWYRLLYASESVGALKTESGLVAATFLTDQLWQSLKSVGASFLIFKIYANNALFVETQPLQDRSNLQSHVLSISIPKVSNKLPLPLVFLLRNQRQEQVHEGRMLLDYYCGYWNYETWQSNGVTTNRDATNDDSNVFVCHTSHVTQFGLLIGGSFRQQRFSDPEAKQHHEFMLDMVTAVGCGLSLFGLMFIWLTAALFERWRSLQATKLLLHLSLAMTLLFGMMLLIYINEWVWRFPFDVHRVGCIALGAMLQYLVLLLFSWMLLIGYLQYRRHVTVFVVSTQHLVLRLSVIAWFLPLPPTLLLLILDRHSYAAVHYEPGDIATVCYPSGSGLVYSILLPIGLVIIINGYVLGRIIYSTSQIQNRSWQLIWPQMRLFILLFSQFGLTWIFGIGSYLQLGLVFSYLFCITGTIQGFILFVYFILLDTKARTAWLEL
ncbi:hypothetical protein KR093_011608, partial [Drosophila rubida]